MKPISLFELGVYSLDWVRDFYSQTGIWWGPNTDVETYATRVKIVERLCGTSRKRILDLGTGPGGTAAALADYGHEVVAIEFSPTRAAFAKELAEQPHRGSLTIVEADFYTVELAHRFDLVTYWDGFGVGTDADQRHLLWRIADSWLAPNGVVVMDVFSPIKPASDAGKEELLPPLAGVPGSVEMRRRCHFDPVNCRWIDEWVPTADPSRALAQTIRCYTPADFSLLLEGTDLALSYIEVDGEEVDLEDHLITVSGPMMDAWSYLVMLELDNGQETNGRRSTK